MVIPFTVSTTIWLTIITTTAEPISDTRIRNEQLAERRLALGAACAKLNSRYWSKKLCTFESGRAKRVHRRVSGKYPCKTTRSRGARTVDGIARKVPTSMAAQIEPPCIEESLEPIERMDETDAAARIQPRPVEGSGSEPGALPRSFPVNCCCFATVLDENAGALLQSAKLHGGDDAGSFPQGWQCSICLMS